MREWFPVLLGTIIFTMNREATNHHRAMDKKGLAEQERIFRVFRRDTVRSVAKARIQGTGAVLQADFLFEDIPLTNPPGAVNIPPNNV